MKSEVNNKGMTSFTSFFRISVVDFEPLNLCWFLWKSSILKFQIKNFGDTSRKHAWERDQFIRSCWPLHYQILKRVSHQTFSQHLSQNGQINFKNQSCSICCKIFLVYLTIVRHYALEFKTFLTFSEQIT